MTKIILQSNNNHTINIHFLYHHQYLTDDVKINAFVIKQHYECRQFTFLNSKSKFCQWKNMNMTCVMNESSLHAQMLILSFEPYRITIHRVCIGLPLKF